MTSGMKYKVSAALAAVVFALSALSPGPAYAYDDDGVEMSSIDVSLVYLDDGGSAMLSGTFHPGNDPDLEVEAGIWYPLDLAVMNSGDAEQYSRVVIDRYFVDPVTGNRIRTMNPDMIKLTFADPATGRFTEDVKARTPESVVLYYDRPIECGGERAFLSGMEIDRAVVVPRVVESGVVSTDEGNKVVTFTKTESESVKACIEVRVDAVQTHNAVDAIWSAWGRRVQVDSDNILSLVD